MDATHSQVIRDRHLSIRLTPNEKCLLEKAAERSNLPISHFVRELSLAACKKE